MAHSTTDCYNLSGFPGLQPTKMATQLGEGQSHRAYWCPGSCAHPVLHQPGQTKHRNRPGQLPGCSLTGKQVAQHLPYPCLG